MFVCTAGKWILPVVIGDQQLPPICYFTLTSLTNDSAILFGGHTINGLSEKVYIIQFMKTSVVSYII